MDGLIFDYKNKEMELIEAKDFTVSFTKSDLDEYNVSNAVDDIFSDVSVDRSKTVINKETLSEKYITLISYLNCIEKKSEGSINALKDMCRSNRIRFCDFKVGKYLFLDTYSAINKDYYIFKYINLDIVIGDCIKYDLVNKSDDFNYITSRDKLYEILEKYKEVFNC
ncbi:hypothetical protein [Clostridium perfringens]|nr:hypothetical protein [Clostridium perfringens]EHP50509.1 hypothetical protein HMPREF9476_00461 [Clostridium perfringens WAL-14572]